MEETKPINETYTVLKTVYISEKQNEWLKSNNVNFSKMVRDGIDMAMNPELMKKIMEEQKK